MLLAVLDWLKRDVGEIRQNRLFSRKTCQSLLQSTFLIVTLGEIMADEGDQDPCDGCKDGIVVDCLQTRDLQAHHVSKAARPARHAIQDLAQQLEFEQGERFVSRGPTVVASNGRGKRKR